MRERGSSIGGPAVVCMYCMMHNAVRKWTSTILVGKIFSTICGKLEICFPKYFPLLEEPNRGNSEKHFLGMF